MHGLERSVCWSKNVKESLNFKRTGQGDNKAYTILRDVSTHILFD